MAVVIAGHELIGSRDRLVGRLPYDKTGPLWQRITSSVVKQGFVVEYRDLEPPRTGIFDGLRIVVDPDVAFEMQCFILLHLFGHSVQWVAPSLAGRLVPLQTEKDKERFLEALKAYEYEAARYGLELLHQAGVLELDQWYSDFVATDHAYVDRYYREDRIPPWEECVVSGAEPVLPVPIPSLRHKQVEVRFAF